MKKIILAIAVILIVIGLGYAIGNHARVPSDPQLLGALSVTKNSYTANNIVSTAYGVTSTAQRILSRNDNRTNAECTNNGPSTAYCLRIATSTGVTATSGQAFAVTGAMNFDLVDPYIGDVYCVTNGSATTSIVCSDK